MCGGCCTVPAHAPCGGAAVLVYHVHLHLGITPSLLIEFLNFDIGTVLNTKYPEKIVCTYIYFRAFLLQCFVSLILYSRISDLMADFNRGHV